MPHRVRGRAGYCGKRGQKGGSGHFGRLPHFSLETFELQALPRGQSIRFLMGNPQTGLTTAGEQQVAVDFDHVVARLLDFLPRPPPGSALYGPSDRFSP